LRKVDNTFNLKPRETNFKLAQARTKNSDEFVNLFLLNYECKYSDCCSGFSQKRLFVLTWFMICTVINKRTDTFTLKKKQDTKHKYLNLITLRQPKKF